MSITRDQPVFVIAEAGVNHDGSLDTARRLVDTAAAAGADAVKFQTFRADRLVSSSAPKAEYQRIATGGNESQLDMLRRLELGMDAHFQLAEHCAKNKIEFLSTAFDVDSLDFLVQRVGMRQIKVGSGEITNAPLLLHAARLRKPIILSTGMSTLAEIEAALGVLAFGYVHATEAPTRAAFLNAYTSAAGRSVLRSNVVLLHCTTEYPAPFDQVNLRAMQTMRTTFGLPVGCSDHTTGIAVPIAAVALGAPIVEKHFTLDRRLPGPDHKASLEPAELEAMVRAIREIELALGSERKEPTASEVKNLAIARRSLVAARDIRAGERFNESNVTLKRPGTGTSPFFYWEVLGRAADRDYVKDEVIST